MAQTPYKQLEQEWKRLHAFRGAMAILRWDAAVMMPRGSAEIRGEQLAALETEYHALVTSPRITRLLDRAQASTDGLEDWQIANLREMRRQRDFAIATPVALVSRLAKAASKAEAKWLQARESGKFEDFAPYLEEVVHLVRDKAQLLGQSRNLSPYDALVDEFSPGLTSAEIDAMFKALGRRLPGLIREVLAQQERRPVLPITGKFTATKQRALALEVMKAVGFPFDRGRLDESEHPFTEGCRATFVSRRNSSPRSRSPACSARCTKPVMRCTTSVCRSNSSISPSAVIAAWRWKRASRCSWKWWYVAAALSCAT